MKTELSKVNQQIRDLAERIIEIEETEASDLFDIREGMIVANVRVYDWLDKEDVDNVIEKHNLSALREEIHEEFNDERLDSIRHHTCEWEGQYMKEMLEGRVHLEDFSKAKMNYRKFLNGEDVDTWRRKEFEKFSKRKYNSPDDYYKYITKQDPIGYREWLCLEQIDHPEVWAYGRSGGWMSICSAEEVERVEYEDMPGLSNLLQIHDNDEFNRWLIDTHYEYYYDRWNKQELIRDMKQWIRNYEDKVEAIEYFVKKFEKIAKGMKEVMLDRLDEEILDFYDMIDSIFEPNADIEANSTHIRTTLGVTVDKREFITAYQLMNRAIAQEDNPEVGTAIPFQRNVGAYFVERAIVAEDDVIIKAGCHRLSMNQITKELKDKGLLAEN